jgi:hypothetical protein
MHFHFSHAWHMPPVGHPILRHETKPIVHVYRKHVPDYNCYTRIGYLYWVLEFIFGDRSDLFRNSNLV